MTNRRSTAALSPVDLSALRRVADGRTKDVKADHLEVLLAMGRAALDQNGRAFTDNRGPATASCRLRSTGY